MEFVMFGRKFVASASFVLLVAGVGARPDRRPSDTARTDDLVKQAVERYTARARSVARAVPRRSRPAAAGRRR